MGWDYLKLGNELDVDPSLICQDESFSVLGGDHWGYWLRGLAFGNGIFAAVGGGGLETSTNGLNWVDNDAPAPAWDVSDMQDLAFGNGRFVAVGGSILVGQPPPRVLTASASAGNLTLAWGPNAVNYRLFSVTNLALPRNWRLESPVLATNAQRIFATLPIGPGRKYFRLQQ